MAVTATNAYEGGQVTAAVVTTAAAPTAATAVNMNESRLAQTMAGEQCGSSGNYNSSISSSYSYEHEGEQVGANDGGQAMVAPVAAQLQT